MSEVLGKHNFVGKRDCRAIVHLKSFLKQHGIWYEPSEYGNGADGEPLVYIQFDFKTEEELKTVQDFLDNIPEDDWNEC